MKFDVYLISYLLTSLGACLSNAVSALCMFVIDTNDLILFLILVILIVTIFVYVYM